jgi:signal transduction histidine kinase
MLPYGRKNATIAHMAHNQLKIARLKKEAGLSPEYKDYLYHEFRKLLNIIIGFTELLLDKAPGKINEEQRRSLNDILDSGRRLLDLVNEVFGPPPDGIKKS